MKTLFAVLIIFIMITDCNSQQPTLEVLGTSNINSGALVRFYNPATLGQKNGNLPEYSDVRGKYFWDDEWRPGLLRLKNNTLVKLKQVKINLYTQEIHYMDGKGAEMIALDDRILGINLYDKVDSTKTYAEFEKYIFEKKPSYFQVLCNGSVWLLKRSTVVLIKSEYNPMAGKSDLHFTSSADYFILKDKTLTKLKSLNKASLEGIIQITSDMEAWLKNERNKLKKEADFVAFINYFNSVSPPTK